MLNFKNNDLKIKTILIAFAFCFVLLLSVFLHASSPVNADQPVSSAAAGSADDPLITLSYINKVYTPMLSKAIDNAIAASINNLSEKLKELETASSNPTVATVPVDSNIPTNPPAQTASSMSGSSSAYTVLELKKGQSVRAKTESLELILRQGSTAAVVSPHKEQGLVDLTAGVELLDGNNLSVNHYLLIPRADGRGITVTSAVAYVMVRGDYEIY